MNGQPILPDSGARERAVYLWQPGGAREGIRGRPTFARCEMSWSVHEAEDSDETTLRERSRTDCGRQSRGKGQPRGSHGGRSRRTFAALPLVASPRSHREAPLALIKHFGAPSRRRCERIRPLARDSSLLGARGSFHRATTQARDDQVRKRAAIFFSSCRVAPRRATLRHHIPFVADFRVETHMLVSLFKYIDMILPSEGTAIVQPFNTTYFYDRCTLTGVDLPIRFVGKS